MAYDDSKPQNQPTTRWIDSGVDSLRPDICQVISSQSEMTLILGTRQAMAGNAVASAVLNTRVVLDPRLAKKLAAALHSAVDQSELLRAADNATPAGIVRCTPKDEDAPPQARPLLHLVQGLGVGFGFEKSLKLTTGSILGDRVILGVRSKLTNAKSLLAICNKMGMPPDHVALFEQSLPQANTVGFGFEGGSNAGVFKVYLEFWDQLRQRIPISRQPALLFLGFKWDVDDNSRCTIARYTCYPLLSQHGINQRLDALYDGRSDSPSLLATREIMNRAARQIGNDSFVYVEAAEEDNPRKSFDINLYKARLRMTDVISALTRLGEQHYGISGQTIRDAVSGARDCPLGHLSGGLGRDGKDFLTAYYELNPL